MTCPSSCSPSSSSPTIMTAMKIPRNAASVTAVAAATAALILTMMTTTTRLSGWNENRITVTNSRMRVFSLFVDGFAYTSASSSSSRPLKMTWTWTSTTVHHRQKQRGHQPFDVRRSATVEDATSSSSSSSFDNDNDDVESLSSFDQSSITSSSSSKSSWIDFEYERRWYPVMWACDLVLNQPTKVTVFDVDFVVAKISDDEVIAMEDICPHKAAALSEGRVTPSGNIQCAYHGWTFNGKTGDCVDIPQVTSVKDIIVNNNSINNDNHDDDDDDDDGIHDSSSANSSNKRSSKLTFPARSCAKAVPAQIHQEMTYIFWGTAEEALAAPPPPTVEEYGKDGFLVSSSVRDMPVDWPIVVSNICDADHGLFAHQAKAFDMYAASKDWPMEVHQRYPNSGKSWTMSTKVDAADKLNEIDRLRRLNSRGTDDRGFLSIIAPFMQDNGGKERKKENGVKETPWATTYFEAPYHLQMKRVDKKSNKTNFITTFYICPVGVGRTRFMGGAVGKKVLPRWVIKLGLDNFLDQDTYLLATQQHHILTQEAKDAREMLKEASGTSLDEKIESIRWKSMPTRRKLFCLSSPTDVLGAKLERFWDATLLRSPNRIGNLLRLDEAGHFLQTPPRSVVLDRKKQVLDVSPHHQDVVKNCKKIRKTAIITSLVAIIAKLLVKTSFFHGWLAEKVDVVLKPSVMLVVFAVSGALASMTNKIISEYFFKYTEEYRRKDMDKIPKKIWKDA